MTTEEKAKAYDEAKLRMSIAFNNNRCTIGFMNEIFPELAVSEDEKIRKDLIEWIGEFPDMIWRGHHKKDIIAWLEKQGKGKYALKSFKDEDVHKFVQYIEKEAKAYELNFPNRGYDIYAFAKDLLTWLEKQGQVKENQILQHDGTHEGVSCKENDDSLTREPKFKVGDWVVENSPNNFARFMQILSVEESLNGIYYKVTRDIHNDTSEEPKEFVENNYHFWTIQDAKDGDILMGKCGAFIYNGVIDKSHNMERPCAYGGICSKHDFDISCSNNGWTNFPVLPATKEQRDLLFQKMHEAGYEWDAKMKEPRKIEQNPALPFDSEPLTEFERAFQGMCSEKNRPFAKDCCKVLLELARKQIKEEIDHKKQNEDDNTLKAIIYTVKNSGYKYCIGVPNEEMIAWLEKRLDLKE